jgi:hypothetical protein
VGFGGVDIEWQKQLLDLGISDNNMLVRASSCPDLSFRLLQVGFRIKGSELSQTFCVLLEGMK